MKFPEQIIWKIRTNDPPNSGHLHKTVTATPPKISLENYLQFYLSIPVINCFDKRYQKPFNPIF
jgi:hypothetical protein